MPTKRAGVNGARYQHPAFHLAVHQNNSARRFNRYARGGSFSFWLSVLLARLLTKWMDYKQATASLPGSAHQLDVQLIILSSCSATTTTATKAVTMRNQIPSLLSETAAPSGKLTIAAIGSSILQDVIGILL